ncbi:undecaprenyl-diphosphate phosphatase [Cohnella caldifontis]|uniref:undecaprenyl-diphosphate phosphatase n=1 Tax=Cohnella caldifontis TaxID=3027471 RepID=UPI0023EAF775|nr:undecaprenyl-diphosphate phosphatase [Cohnella sp. YIM B05605]
MLHGYDSIILGIVEGLTEFLPVSSTGHMILTNQLLGYGQSTPDELKSFEVVIQFAAILAIAIVYWRRILQVLGFKGIETAKGLSVQSLPKRRMNLIHVLLGIVPPLAVAFLFRHPIKDLGFSTAPVLWALVVGGIYMWIAEALYDSGKIKRTSETLDDITYKQALIIGLIQCVSVWPGFSRSGSTIAGGMLAGLSYRASADFSFFIAIPIMTAATGYELLDNLEQFRSGAIDVGFLVTGFIVSFAVAWIVVVGFLKVLQKIKLRYFAWYRFVLAALFYWFIMR